MAVDVVLAMVVWCVIVTESCVQLALRRLANTN
jgi:hypothetical protein